MLLDILQNRAHLEINKKGTNIMAQRVYDPRVKVPGFLKVSKIVSWLMYAWVIFGIAVLTIRVFLIAFSANASAGFSQFIINTSGQYLNPFRGIFPPKPVSETGYLDVSALFAIVVYIFIAWAFSALNDYIQNKIDLSKETQQHEIDERKMQKRIAISKSSRTA